MIKLPFSEILPVGICSFSKATELRNCRAKSRIPDNARSIITYLFPYFLGKEFYINSNISKYAVPDDYHLIAGEYLKKAAEQLSEQFPQNSFEPFCDNSPLNEVEIAVNCGLGVKGKNGLLINQEYGSFCFIGEIITDLKTEYSLSEDRTCLQCGLCEKKCPGNALNGYKVDVTKCLSDITQLKGELSAEQIELVKASSCIWGCDICQDVCPMNKEISVTPIKEFFETAKNIYEPTDDIAKRAYNWRGKKVIDRNFEINCCKDI